MRSESSESPIPASRRLSPDIAMMSENTPLFGRGLVVADGATVGVALAVGVPGKPSHAMPLRFGSRLSTLLVLLPPFEVKYACASGWVLKSAHVLAAAVGVGVAVCAAAAAASGMAQ